MQNEPNRFDPALPTEETSPYQPGNAMKPVSTNGMALTGFILGIMSVTIGCIICPPAFSIPGLIFSLIGRGQIRQSGEGGQGLAFTGILLSSISLGLMLLFIIAYIALIAVGMATGSLEDFK